MNINVDFAQYKSFAEANEHAKRLSKEIITEVKTDLAQKDLEDLQKQDIYEK